MILTQEEFEKKYLEVHKLVSEGNEQIIRNYLIKSLIDDPQSFFVFVAVFIIEQTKMI